MTGLAAAGAVGVAAEGGDAAGFLSHDGIMGMNAAASTRRRWRKLMPSLMPENGNWGKQKEAQPCNLTAGMRFTPGRLAARLPKQKKRPAF